MYYFIIELSSGKLFATDFLEVLPHDAVSFTVIDGSRKDEEGFPFNYHFKIGKIFHDETSNKDNAYTYTGVEVVLQNTLYVENYKELNDAFVNNRIMHDIATR